MLRYDAGNSRRRFFIRNNQTEFHETDYRHYPAVVQLSAADQANNGSGLVSWRLVA
jgi:hypothetical protein